MVEATRIAKLCLVSALKAAQRDKGRAAAAAPQQQAAPVPAQPANDGGAGIAEFIDFAKAHGKMLEPMTGGGGGGSTIAPGPLPLPRSP